MAEQVPETAPEPVFYFSYDKAFVNWLAPIRDHNNRTLDKVFATPERAFAQIRERIAKRTNRQFAEDEKNKALPLPMISITRILAGFDPDRYHKATVLYRVNQSRTAYGAYQHPYPYKIDYQVDFWTRQFRDMDYLCEQFHLLFDSDLVYITVVHPNPFGSRIVPLRLESITDASDLESGEKQRMIRRTATVRVFGWLPRVPYEIKLIRNVTTQYRDAKTGALLDTEVIDP